MGVEISEFVDATLTEIFVNDMMMSFVERYWYTHCVDALVYLYMGESIGRMSCPRDKVSE